MGFRVEGWPWEDSLPLGFTGPFLGALGARGPQTRATLGAGEVLEEWRKLNQTLLGSTVSHCAKRC